MFRVNLPWPPSVNTYWRQARGVIYITKEGKEYRKQVVALLADAPKFGDSLVKVIIDIFPPDRRKRDIDNLTKCLLDALTHAGVWEDDSQVDELRLKRARDESGELILLGCVSVEVSYGDGRLSNG